MLNNIEKKELFEKSSFGVISYLKNIKDTNEQKKALIRLWNAYCHCRNCDGIELFDKDDKVDMEIWNKSYGVWAYPSINMALCLSDYINHEINIRYITNDELLDIIEKEFSDIYQYVLVYPYCFESYINELVILPIIKKIGIVDQNIVGFM